MTSKLSQASILFCLVCFITATTAVNECSKLSMNTLRSLSNDQINAEEIDPHSLPWQAVIFYKGSPFCGGALIAPKWVITGAHCLPAWMPSSNVEVKLGIYDLFQSTTKQQSFKILKIKVHPEFDAKSFSYDVAAIELDKRVDINEYVSPICILEESIHFPAGYPCLVSGWGFYESDNSKLKFLQIRTIDVKVCNSSKYYNGAISSTMACAGMLNAITDICHGDSGGPLICRQPESDYAALSGIIFWGQGCGSIKDFTVFTDISKIINWLKETTGIDKS